MERKEIQLRTRSKIIITAKGRALAFGFHLGPIAIFIIANLPENDGNQQGPLVYIKTDIRINEEWQEYSVESSKNGW